MVGTAIVDDDGFPRHTDSVHHRFDLGEQLGDDLLPVVDRNYQRKHIPATKATVNIDTPNPIKKIPGRKLHANAVLTLRYDNAAEGDVGSMNLCWTVVNPSLPARIKRLRSHQKGFPAGVDFEFRRIGFVAESADTSLRKYGIGPSC